MWLAAAAAVIVLLGGVTLGVLWSDAESPTPGVQKALTVRPLQAPSEPPRTVRTDSAPPKRAIAKRGTVVAHGHAIFLHASEPPNEVVRLVEGSITVSVDKLLPGERFRVVTGDGEVEVKGTVFDVTVADDQLLGVRVVLGRVEVRKEDAPTVTLEAGGRWASPVSKPKVDPAPEPIAEPTLPPVKTVKAPAPARRPKTARKRAVAKATKTTVPKGGTSEPTAGSTLFRDGWTAYRSGRLGEAEQAFARVLKQPGGALSSDAAFWRAMTLKRMGKAGAATKAFRYFLKRFGSSARAAEARVLLGWLRFGAGARDEARGLFQQASKARSAKVRASAEKGLKRLEQ